MAAPSRVLALAIYSDDGLLHPRRILNWDLFKADLADRKTLATHLVDRGAPLRDVAAVMNIPMMLRRIKAVINAPGIGQVPLGSCPAGTVRKSSFASFLAARRSCRDRFS
jgi:hypothetical protein